MLLLRNMLGTRLVWHGRLVHCFLRCMNGRRTYKRLVGLGQAAHSGIGRRQEYWANPRIKRSNEPQVSRVHEEWGKRAPFFMVTRQLFLVKTSLRLPLGVSARGYYGWRDRPHPRAWSTGRCKREGHESWGTERTRGCEVYDLLPWKSRPLSQQESLPTTVASYDVRTFT